MVLASVPELSMREEGQESLSSKGTSQTIRGTSHQEAKQAKHIDGQHIVGVGCWCHHALGSSPRGQWHNEQREARPEATIGHGDREIIERLGGERRKQANVYGAASLEVNSLNGINIR